MISVVIPVFNGEKFVLNCYRSLIKQTFSDWEAIFIDDGSIDGTLDELRKLATTDNRVRVIHKDNEGVAIAREVGVKKALGEFITFLDVDDTLVEDALEQFVVPFKCSYVDIVVAGINMISESGDIQSSIHYPRALLSSKEAVFKMSTGSVRWQLCGKAFRTDLFDGVITPKGLRSAEDMAVCIQAFVRAQSIAVLSSCLYNYIQVSTSVTHSKALEISYDALAAGRFVERIIGSKMDQLSLDCLFLLIISSALRAGISVSDNSFWAAVVKHGNIHSIQCLPIKKAVNICLYRYLNLNIAKFL